MGALSALSRCRERYKARTGDRAGSACPGGAGSLGEPYAKPVNPVKSPWWGDNGNSGRTACNLGLHGAAVVARVAILDVAVVHLHKRYTYPLYLVQGLLLTVSTGSSEIQWDTACIVPQRLWIGG